MRAYAEAANACLEAGDNDGATAYCADGLAEYPSSVALRIQLARALVALGRAADAMREFEAAVAIDKDNPHAYKLVAQALIRKGLYRSAIPLLKKAAALTPSDDSLNTSLNDTQQALKGGPPPDANALLQNEVQALIGREKIEEEPPIIEGVAIAEALPTTSDAPLEDEEPILDGALLNFGDSSPGQTASTPSGSLLADLPFPEEETFTPRLSAPDSDATDAARREYQRTLSAALEEKKDERTFLQRHALKVGLLAALVVGAGALAGSYWYTRSRNQGETYESAFAKAESALDADTKESYESAIKLFGQVIAMDSKSPRAKAGIAYANAMLYAEHGKLIANRDAAQAALDDAARAAAPEYALLVDYLLTGPSQADAVVKSTIDKSVVHAHAGRLLLDKKEYDAALNRLKKAIELDPRQVIALVSLGSYYEAFDDFEQAATIYKLATDSSKLHPLAVIGRARVSVKLGSELPEALASIDALFAAGGIPPEEKADAILTRAEVLAVNRKSEEAVALLKDGLKEFGGTRAADFQFALAQALRMGGKMRDAQQVLEGALLTNPKDDRSNEALGRVLTAQGLDADVIARVKGDTRGIALVRGIAYTRMGDDAHAREELNKTQIAGKLPAEAVVYLALGDATKGPRQDEAVSQLEKLANSNRRDRSLAQTALARVYLRQGRIDKAKSMLTLAAASPTDYEANALLGQLLYGAAEQPEAALAPLKTAIERNNTHWPSRHAYILTLLALGKNDEAVKQAEDWTALAPSMDAAWGDAARANLQAGNLKAAYAAAQKLSSAKDDADLYRVKAAVFFAVGDPKAIPALQEAAAIDTDDARTYCEIGNAYVRISSYEKAPDAYKRAAELDPQLPCSQVGLLHAKPSASAARGLPPPREALATLAGKSHDVWEKAFIQATLARVLLQDRDVKGAFAQATDATTSAPFSPVAWYAMGEVAEAKKDYPAAKDAFAKAVGLDASWVGARMQLGDALVRAGDGAAAAAEYRYVAGHSQDDAEVKRAKRAASSAGRNETK